MNVASRLSPEEIRSLRVAPMATLDAQARSGSARALTALLAKELTKWEAATSRRKNERKGRLEKLEPAIGAFVADLLGACNHREANGWTWRSLRKGAFTRQKISFRDFDAVVNAWIACGLLERIAGFKETIEFDPGDPIRVRGKASRFRATPKLLAICTEHGITPQNASEHFAYSPPEHALRLNAFTDGFTAHSTWVMPKTSPGTRAGGSTAMARAPIKRPAL